MLPALHHDHYIICSRKRAQSVFSDFPRGKDSRTFTVWRTPRFSDWVPAVITQHSVMSLSFSGDCYDQPGESGAICHGLCEHHE